MSLVYSKYTFLMKVTILEIPEIPSPKGIDWFVLWIVNILLPPPPRIDWLLRLKIRRVVHNLVDLISPAKNIKLSNQIETIRDHTIHKESEYFRKKPCGGACIRRKFKKFELSSRKI